MASEDTQFELIVSDQKQSIYVASCSNTMHRLLPLLALSIAEGLGSSFDLWVITCNKRKGVA